MSTALHFKSNLRDIYFNLFELNDIGANVLGRAPYGALDEESAREALAGLEELCRLELASSFVDSDRTPLRQDELGDVILPDSLKKSLKAYWDAQWQLLELPEHLGGFGAPPSVVWAAFELVAGAHASAAFYLFGAVIARVIDRLATPEQKLRVLKPHIARGWGGSMVLTEPDAGSDVGAGRARATHLEDDIWTIEGTKRFITNGDFDGVENILHLVLARPDGADVGTKGLSLFIVPKYWINEDGTLGERNGVRISKLEKKMGNVHDGIRQMFHVIEQARMAVGIKSMATLSTAYLNALAYTKERVQGPDLQQAADKKAPRVRIIEHPDVRRMLMAQKAHVEAMRALAFFTTSIQDQVELLGGHGDARASQLDALNDFLLPLVKGWCSEKATEMLGISLQCIGGSGYVQDYPFEQYLRDQKIDSLYEGTTHIQALDLLFRKILRDKGATLMHLFGRIQQTLDDADGGEELLAERAMLARGMADVQGIVFAMQGKLKESVYHAGLQGNRILFAVAELVAGWLLVRQAGLAVRKLPTASRADQSFYAGKVAAAKWYCRNVLPTATLTRKLIESSELSLMDVPEAVF